MSSKTFDRESRLLTPEMIAKLLDNNKVIEEGGDPNTLDIVARLFTPDANGTWIIVFAELWGDQDLQMWGWCDPGLGFPEFGYVLLSELEELRGHWGLPVERDTWFITDECIGEYVEGLLLAKKDQYV